MDKKLFLKKLYIAIKHRTTNPKSEKSKKFYKGLEIMNKAVFMSYINDPMFNKLYDNWIASKKCRKLVPTCDRINPMKGYTKCNIIWRTLSANSKLVRFYLRPNRNKDLPVGVRKSAAKHVTKYEARIRDNYKYIHLGTFDTIKDAEAAYLKALNRLDREKS